jgi:hypothetical protein
VRRGNRLALADLAGEERTLYDVVLLAGSPRRSTLALGLDLAEGSVIEVDGEQWTVADVRVTDDGPPQLICIYAV